ncbi:MAG: DUF4111 domain-containing protein [Dehalococcoidales bacterium]|nr:DUF4111 domain-containing protein [Dehalococcoidales bacterium]
MKYTELPGDVRQVCDEFVPGLRDALGEKLYGVYLYGSVMFPDSCRITDIDCHVVLNTRLTEEDRKKIRTLYDCLSSKYPLLGNELDAWYILLEEAGKDRFPQNQLKTDRYDESWALHCAHIRGGKYLALYGPEPINIFPRTTWKAVTEALDWELDYIRKNLKYPAYCVMNLCRILYSFTYRDVVVSKRFSGRWLSEKYPEWAGLIEAAVREYDGTETPEDRQLLDVDLKNFYDFATERISIERMKK